MADTKKYTNEDKKDLQKVILDAVKSSVFGDYIGKHITESQFAKSTTKNLELLTAAVATPQKTSKNITGPKHLLESIVENKQPSQKPKKQNAGKKDPENETTEKAEETKQKSKGRQLFELVFGEINKTKGFSELKNTLKSVYEQASAPIKFAKNVIGIFKGKNEGDEKKSGDKPKQESKQETKSATTEKPPQKKIAQSATENDDVKSTEPTVGAKTDQAKSPGRRKNASSTQKKVAKRAIETENDNETTPAEDDKSETPATKPKRNAKKTTPKAVVENTIKSTESPDAESADEGEPTPKPAKPRSKKTQPAPRAVAEKAVESAEPSDAEPSEKSGPTPKTTTAVRKKPRTAQKSVAEKAAAQPSVSATEPAEQSQPQESNNAQPEKPKSKGRQVLDLVRNTVANSEVGQRFKAFKEEVANSPLVKIVSGAAKIFSKPKEAKQETPKPQSTTDKRLPERDEKGRFVSKNESAGKSSIDGNKSLVEQREESTAMKLSSQARERHVSVESELHKRKMAMIAEESASKQEAMKTERENQQERLALADELMAKRDEELKKEGKKNKGILGFINAEVLAEKWKTAQSIKESILRMAQSAKEFAIEKARALGQIAIKIAHGAAGVVKHAFSLPLPFSLIALGVSGAALAAAAIWARKKLSGDGGGGAPPSAGGGVSAEPKEEKAPETGGISAENVAEKGDKDAAKKMAGSMNGISSLVSFEILKKRQMEKIISQMEKISEKLEKLGSLGGGGGNTYNYNESSPPPPDQDDNNGVDTSNIFDSIRYSVNRTR